MMGRMRCPVAIVNTSAESLTLTAETYGSTQDNFLYGVSCKSMSFSMASGEYSNGTNDQTLIEKWNGSAWSLVGSLNSSSTQDNDLSAMSCVSTSYCMATGGYNNGTNLQTLTEKWSGGSWSLVGSANTSSTQINFLDGVSCVSKNFCMAAGNSSNGSNDQTLIEKWNGSTWNLVNSPNSSSTQNNHLGGVSCVSTGFCMATGRDRNASNDQTRYPSTAETRRPWPIAGHGRKALFRFEVC